MAFPGSCGTRVSACRRTDLEADRQPATARRRLGETECVGDGLVVVSALSAPKSTAFSRERIDDASAEEGACETGRGRRKDIE